MNELSFDIYECQADVITSALTCHDPAFGRYAYASGRERGKRTLENRTNPPGDLMEEGHGMRGEEDGPAPFPIAATSVASALIAVLGIAMIWCGTVTRGADDPSASRRPPSRGRSMSAPPARRSRTEPDAGSGRRDPEARLHDPAGHGRRRLREIVSRATGRRARRPRARGRQGQGPEPARQIAAAIEIKGLAGVQRIPLAIQPEWTPIEEAVDWPAIGAFREVVLSVSHTGDGGPATGTILIDGRFEQLSPLRKLGMLPSARLAGVILASLLLALLIGLAAGDGAAMAGNGPSDRGEESRSRSPPHGSRGPERSWGISSGAAGSVFIVLLAMGIFLLGEQRPLDAGWTALGMAVAGAAIAEWWKFGLTGKHLTAARGVPGRAGIRPAGRLREPDGDPPAAGILGRAPALEPDRRGDRRDPLSRGQRLSDRFFGQASGREVAAPDRRHSLRRSAAWCCWNRAILLRILGDGLTAGALATSPAVAEFVGRVLVVFCFNEAVAAGLGLATEGRLLRSPAAHLAMLAVAIAAVAAPWVAALGSGAAVASWPVAQRWIATVLTTILSQAGLWAEAYLVTGWPWTRSMARPRPASRSSGIPSRG